jgi:heat shock protein HslJ
MSPRLARGLAGALVALAAGCMTTAPDSEAAGWPAAPATASAATLVGTEWLLEDLAGRGVLDRVPASLGFPEAGRVAGLLSCNRFNGSVQLGDDGSVRIGPLVATRMGCPPAVMEQEERYARALEAARRLRFDGPFLLLDAEGHDRPLRFTRSR